MKNIIYPNGTGVSVITPDPNCGLTLEQIAIKDVPAGLPYLFIDPSHYPADRSKRHLWQADFSDPDGHGGFL